jgi:hypothetical protein
MLIGKYRNHAAQGGYVIYPLPATGAESGTQSLSLKVRSTSSTQNKNTFNDVSFRNIYIYIHILYIYTHIIYIYGIPGVFLGK